MIHSYNNPSNQKRYFYIDAESELGRPEGGNGKSLVMQSLRHYKKMSQQDGRRYQKNINGGGRFQFANVNVDTKFVLIDDLESGFKYEQLFSMITEKMEIEKKGKDKFTLDEKENQSLVLLPIMFSQDLELLIQEELTLLSLEVIGINVQR